MSGHNWGKLKHRRRLLRPGAALFLALFATTNLHAQVIVPSAGVYDDPAPEDEAQAQDQSNDREPAFRPVPVETQSKNASSFEDSLAARPGLLDQAERMKSPPKPGEFEKFVKRKIGRALPRYGQDLILPGNRDFATPATAAVPPDYRLNVGDTVVISLVGSLTGSVEREINTNGDIFLPNVGAIALAGVRFGDLREKISEAIGIEYRGYGFDVSVRKLRGVRIYVTGFANNPGAFTVNSLSSAVNAVFQAGGPSAGGSFRSVKLFRNGREVGDIDLYELLRGGNRVNDAVLQNEDVLYIPPAGPQYAVIGSVQEEAIYEALPGETIDEALAAAGGANTLGDPDRVMLHRAGAEGAGGPIEVSLNTASAHPVAGGDIIEVLSVGTLMQPTDRQSVLVRIEGEVNRPGHYQVPPGTTLKTLVEMAGGTTPRAFPFGAELVRLKVREQQREGYQQAISQMENALTSAPLLAPWGVDEAKAAAQVEAARALLAKMRMVEPDGRIVLGVKPDAEKLPGEIRLENEDHLIVPTRPSTIGVFGAVYSPSTFYVGERPLKVRAYIEKAGGVQRAADKSRIFVVRANGEVLTKKKGALSAEVAPGDIIFVPVKSSSGQFWSRLESFSAMVFRFGLTAAAVAAIN